MLSPTSKCFAKCACLWGMVTGVTITTLPLPVAGTHHGEPGLGGGFGVQEEEGPRRDTRHKTNGKLFVGSKCG